MFVIHWTKGYIYRIYNFLVFSNPDFIINFAAKQLL
jgi:hypothetical protein